MADTVSSHSPSVLFALFFFFVFPLLNILHYDGLLLNVKLIALFNRNTILASFTSL